MPKSKHLSDINDEIYNEIKGLRSSETSKRLRRLRAFERMNYKKTCEVKKTGHSLDDEHRLNDGNLRYSSRNLTYSLNKKKRWLLPDIIEQRICEHNPNSQIPKSKKGDQMSTIDERLKIVMYENENTHHSSTCIRYANSQTEPHVLHKNGRRFNSVTLTKWMDFNTRERPNNRHPNQSNFGVQQRPGFFPSEVTYEFLYPKRLLSSESFKNGKTSLFYTKPPEKYYWYRRHPKDVKKNRRNEHLDYHFSEQEYNFEQENIDDNEFIISSLDIMDENEKWSIVFEDSNDDLLSSIDFPIDHFIPSSSSNCKSHSQPVDIIDHKAHKYFEPPLTISDKTLEKPVIIKEDLLCSIRYENESDFLSLMQQSTMKISQANLSPPIFLQRTSTSSFSVIYTYSRTSSMVDITVKFSDLRPNIIFSKNEITLEKLIELISDKLDKDQLKSETKSIKIYSIDVDALRGSLPLPLTISQKMVLVKPNSTDKQTALEIENQINKSESKQWFDTTETLYEIFECSICCETLCSNDAYQLLPCYHTLCHSCLTSYIRTNISSTNPLSLTCFQPNCSTEVNSSLIQAFISYDIYNSYNQSLIERHLFSTGHYRKCPSRNCSDLLIVDDDFKPALMCSCGQRVCSTCLEEYHFPATCKQYKSYATRLQQSSDHLLSISKSGDNSSCYIAEGKNCPSCGEFVEKNGGCPHMTCKCGNEYCWMCLKRWSTHNYSSCFNVPELTHELRSSTRSRFYNKALNHRRQRNQHSFNTLITDIQRLKPSSEEYNLILSTYIDLNTLAEFVYVLLQRRRINGNIRAVLGQTANRLETDAFKIKLQIECKQIKTESIEEMRSRLERTFKNLVYMKNNKVLM